MKPKNVRAFAALAAMVATAGLVSGCGSSSASNAADQAVSGGQIVVRIPDPGNYGALALGKKDGSFAAALAAVGAKVDWVGTAGPFAPAAQELDSNELDIAQGSITSAVAAIAQSPGFKLFADVAPDKIGEGILVKNNSGITTVADLVGKNVIVAHGGTEEYLLLKALAKNGIAANKVNRIYLPPPQSGPVFHSGQADAWATWSSFSLPEIANQNEHLLVTGGEVGSQNYAVWAVRNGFLTAHPTVVKAIYTYLHANEQKQAKNPAAYINVFRTSGPDAVSGQLRTLTEQDLAQLAPTSAITATDKAAFSQVAQFFVDQGVIPGTVEVNASVVDVSSLPGS